ncbi:hypothetical protein FRC12_013553 [Ceratobasidium sp. 428]|nr:hypothetical protein FRC12_013553 [Ceratobasidium sp. 428]
MYHVATRLGIPERPLNHILPNDSQGDMLWSLMKNCWLYEPEERPTAEQVYKTPESNLMPTMAR